MLRKSKRFNTNEGARNLEAQKIKRMESHISLVTPTSSNRGWRYFYGLINGISKEY